VHAQIATNEGLAGFKSAAAAALNPTPATFLRAAAEAAGNTSSAVAAATAAEAAAAAGNFTTPSVPSLITALEAAADRVPPGIVDAFESVPVHAAAKFRVKMLMEPTDPRLVDDVLTTSTALLAGQGLVDAMSATSLDDSGLTWWVEQVSAMTAPPPPPSPPDAPPTPLAPLRRAPTLLDSGMLIPIASAAGGVLFIAACARMLNRFRARNVKVAPARGNRR
jgi:hypothetical protein